MENKEFTELANSWVERRKRIDSADVFNRQLLSETLVAKSFWLAPKPMAFCIMLSMFFIFAMTYCVLAKPSYWPVAAMCIFGLADTAWQTSMRDKIRRMDGGVVGLQTNLLRYRRGQHSDVDCDDSFLIVVRMVLRPLFRPGNGHNLHFHPRSGMHIDILLAHAQDVPCSRRPAITRYRP